MNNITSAKYFIVFSTFFLLILINSSAHAAADTLRVADNELIRLDSIKLTGNSATEDFIILRELTVKIGDTVSGKSLRFNRERVFSLRIFNRVDFNILRENDLNTLEIRLYESWYFYPIPYFRTHNWEFKKGTYGLNFSYINFRGRNETIRAMVGFGYEPSYSLSFDNPALIFENGIGISVSSFYTKLNNKSVIAKNITGEDFKYKIYSQNLSVSKRFDHFNMSFINIGFSYLETGYSIMPITASGSRIDRVLSAGLSYIYDSRDLKQYSENGLFVFSNFTHKGFGINNINYSNFELDFREYIRIISSLSVKWRIVYRTSFGNTIPLYDFSSLGYFERVRGHYDDIREGKSYLVGSIELNYPVLREWNLSLNLPLLPQSLTTTRIAIYLTGFADTGDAFGAGKPFSTGNFYSGYGFGITILFLPFNAVRFEYAMDEYGKGELIIGTGFSF